MPSQFTNPFPESDADRHAIWEMLVDRDITAFLAADWSMVENDFAKDRFMGVHGHGTTNPDHWRLAFPSLDEYRDEWLRQAQDFQKETYKDDPRTAIFSATVLRDIEINGDRAIVHKKFDGSITKESGEKDILNWQTVYYCHRVDGAWRIAGFNGYLPNPMG